MPNQPLAQLTDSQRKLLELARGMAAHDPDAAEYLANQLSREVRHHKAPLGFGIVLRYNAVAEQVEIRGGDIARGYWEQDPTASYAEYIAPLPRGTRKEG